MDSLPKASKLLLSERKSMLSLEQTLLSTYMWADLQLTEDETKKIQSLEMREEFFQEHYHKLIVKTINSLKQESKPFYMEYVAEVMQEQGNFNDEAFNIIMTTNQVTSNTFFNYYNSLGESNIKLHHGDI